MSIFKSKEILERMTSLEDAIRGDDAKKARRYEELSRSLVNVAVAVDRVVPILNDNCCHDVAVYLRVKPCMVSINDEGKVAIDPMLLAMVDLGIIGISEYEKISIAIDKAVKETKK